MAYSMLRGHIISYTNYSLFNLTETRLKKGRIKENNFAEVMIYKHRPVLRFLHNTMFRLDPFADSSSKDALLMFVPVFVSLRDCTLYDVKTRDK